MSISVPISVALSAADSSGGAFDGGTTYFNFGPGSQYGAPQYQSASPTLTPTSTSSAALGGNAAAAAPGGASSLSTGSTTTDILIAAGIGVALIAAFIAYRKGVL